MDDTLVPDSAITRGDFNQLALEQLVGDFHEKIYDDIPQGHVIVAWGPVK